MHILPRNRLSWEVAHGSHTRTPKVVPLRGSLKIPKPSLRGSLKRVIRNPRAPLRFKVESLESWEVVRKPSPEKKKKKKT